MRDAHRETQGDDVRPHISNQLAFKAGVIALLGATLPGSSALNAISQSTQQTPRPLAIESLGGSESYGFYCAPCHGRSGKGDGPVASALRTHPADLTTLAERNGGAFPRERVYAYVDPDGILQLTKRLWPLPDAMDVIFPEVPFATEVGPEQHFEERILLSLPISIDYPYGLELEEHERKPEEVLAVAGGVVFSIGYLVEEAGPLRSGPAKLESGASFVLGFGTASENQRILQGGTMGIGVPVKELRH